MSELNDDARLLLDLARDAHEPGDADRARVRAELASRIGVAAGLGLAAGLGATAKTTATAVTGAQIAAGAVGAGALTAKLIAAALIVSATVGAVATAVHHRRQAALARRAVAAARVQAVPAARPAADVAAPPRPSVPGGELARPTATLSCPKAQPIVRGARVKVSVSPVVPTVPVAAPAAAAPTPPPAAAPPAARPAVDGEVKLVQDALVARRSGQPARALEILNRHVALYPQGVLAEERDAERALALADLGRVAEARAAIEAFLRAYPGSSLAARLRERARQLD